MGICLPRIFNYMETGNKLKPSRVGLKLTQSLKAPPLLSSFLPNYSMVGGGKSLGRAHPYRGHDSIQRCQQDTVLSPAPWVPAFQEWRVTKTHGPRSLPLCSPPSPPHCIPQAPEPRGEVWPSQCSSAHVPAACSQWLVSEGVCLPLHHFVVGTVLAHWLGTLICTPWPEQGWC